ncbi:AraC family transcriptional regulator [Vallicoccus soli]|uniref:AraC family transcriptional regulator n=1 Tax=Vallicoccus soli TaxID=2339232 RepID=A0A3A3ZLN8_9ACTN|nr:AraC family transcriptional regulator [Vallicoccus soli]RJK97112.1 AraC family transcriptional regulator [Vallicoccus soli]
MDPLAGLLDGPRARGAFVLRSELDPPWALRVQDRAPLTVLAVVRGAAWLLPDAGPRERLAAGDIAVVRGPGAYGVADDPATPVQAVIHPGQRCTTPAGVEVPLGWQGPRTWGGAREGSTRLVTGTYQEEGAVSRRLLAALPPVLVARAGPGRDGPGGVAPVVAWLAREAAREDPGQEAVLDRLLDLLLVAVLRGWFDRPGARPPGWYAAAADPVVGPALRLLQSAPERAWTVTSLAAAVGTSRTALARRFTALVGEPPMAYLTAWRLDLAADLLREPGTTVAAVARRVGYGSPFALSAAFKRERGVSPAEHRAAAG